MDTTHVERLAIEHRTPLDDLIEKEERNDCDTLDMGELGQIPADALAKLCRFLIPVGNPLTPSLWRTAARRLCALSHQLQIEGVGDKSLTDLAKALGCTRSLLSLLCCEIRDEGHLQHRSGKSKQARQHYSDRAREVWNRRAATAKAKRAASED
jgi:DNA-binding Xre family transcriptional regulator